MYGAPFLSVKRLTKHINAFIETYNQNATLFVWTKAKAHQTGSKTDVSTNYDSEY